MLGGMALLWNWRARQRAAGQAHRQAQHDLRPRAGLLAQVRAVLGRRAARDPDGGRPLHHERRRGRSSASTRTPSASCRPSASTFTGQYEPVARGQRRARQAAGGDRARHPDPRRRGERRLHRAVHHARPGLGLPAAAREVDQHLGPQVRARAARRRLGRVAGCRGAARGPDLQRQLPRRRTCRRSR